MGDNQKINSEGSKEFNSFFNPLFFGMTKEEDKEFKKGLNRATAIILAFFGFLIINFRLNDVIKVIEKIKYDLNLYLGIVLILSAVMIYISCSIDYMKYKKELKMSMLLFGTSIIVSFGLLYFFPNKIINVPNLDEFLRFRESDNILITIFNIAKGIFSEYLLAIIFIVFFSLIFSSLIYVIKIFILSFFDNFNQKIGDPKDSLTLIIAIFGAVLSLFALRK